MDCNNTGGELSAMWNGVIEYLKTNPANASENKAHPSYVLDLSNTQRDLNTSNSMDLAILAGGTTLLSTLRRKRDIITFPDNDGNVDNNMDVDLTGRLSDERVDRSHEWAIDKLHAFSRNDAMDTSELSDVWRLPGENLAELCGRHLLLDEHTDLAFAQFINTIVTDARVSLENQRIILRRISSSKWFTNGEAIPAVIHSQIASLLLHHSEAIVGGLVLPLLEKPEQLLQPSASMIAKVIRMEISVESQEIISSTLAIAAGTMPQAFDETMFQIMEALVTKMPADRVSAKWSKCWIEILHHIVPQRKDSKKLSALILQIVNKFGNHLEPGELDQIARMATILSTSLKRAIAAAVKRKQKG